MAGETLVIDSALLQPDGLATRISDFYMKWETLRQTKVTEWAEISRYVFATDTTKTTNSKLPWSNKTTIPKLCQIRDNLASNYMASMFPRKKWLRWEGDTQEDEAKKEAIESYMNWVIDRNQFYDEIARLVLDYIDYGNAICTVDWYDGRIALKESNIPPQQVGYVGPVIRRISPLDIVFNPTAPSFERSPKIVQSFVSIGEIKKLLTSESLSEEEREEADKLYQYMLEIRRHVTNHPGNIIVKDQIYAMTGFTSFREYLESNYVEVLTFYGDIYDEYTDTFLQNHMVKVVDRHKIMEKRPNPSFFGTAPIYHAGWRIRQDNVWAMGPLDNLVGMQYRIDHLENMKADVFDLIAYPPLKIKGYVEEFVWGPFEKIYVSEEGDVELMSPAVQALQADNQIAILEQKMEQMAGSPKEAMGFRTPGEKTAYEVQRLENAASRIFQNKIAQLERQITENALNAMLELSRRRLDPTSIRIFNSELKIAAFKDLSAEDITGAGRLKPFAARHYAEQAIQVQNLNNFFGSAAGQDQSVLMHFSTVETAKLWEDLLELKDTHIVQPFVRIAETAEAQQLQHSAMSQATVSNMTPAGILPGDHDKSRDPRALAGYDPMGGPPPGPGGAGSLPQNADKPQ